MVTSRVENKSWDRVVSIPSQRADIWGHLRTTWSQLWSQVFLEHQQSAMDGYAEWTPGQ